MKKKTLLMTGLLFAGITASAQKPIVQTEYTADPAPLVYNDTVYLYTSHDEDDADGFKMVDWLLYTSTDMVNWTDHGAVASLKDFDKWHKHNNGAWAQQVVERNGKFYMYCPLHGNGIGVLVADSPYGPFKDPLGKPLIAQADIDPTVWIDDDGQAYMYWGNPKLLCVKLNEDMISLKGEIMKMETPEHYQEGPWFYKRKDKYYLAFASTCCPEGMGYSMSDNPLGPWKFNGYIMKPSHRSNGNHPGIIEYKGKSYVFGQNYELLRLLTDKFHERRSVSVAELTYNADGSIQELPFWTEVGAKQIEWFNPYRRVEAETMAWGFGLKTKPHPGAATRVVTRVDDGDTLQVRGVDFGKKGAKQLQASVASAKGGCLIEIHEGHADGPLLGTLQVPATGGADTYKLLKSKLQRVKGVHDLVFRFKSTSVAKHDLLNWDYWRMK